MIVVKLACLFVGAVAIICGLLWVGLWCVEKSFRALGCYLYFCEYIWWREEFREYMKSRERKL